VAISTMSRCPESASLFPSLVDRIARGRHLLHAGQAIRIHQHPLDGNGLGALRWITDLVELDSETQINSAQRYVWPREQIAGQRRTIPPPRDPS